MLLPSACTSHEMQGIVLVLIGHELDAVLLLARLIPLPVMFCYLSWERGYENTDGTMTNSYGRGLHLREE